MVENDAGECPTCGSSHADRQRHRARNKDDDIPLGFTYCTFCNGQKCCICDMGRDVKCINCDEALNEE